MQFFRLLTALIGLGLLIVTINSALSTQLHIDNEQSPENDLSHLEEELYAGNFENSVNSLPTIPVESVTSGETVNKEQDREDSVHRERRAAQWARSKEYFHLHK